MFVFSYVSFDCLYIYMWLSLLQAWIYQHFRGIGSKDAWDGYQDDMHPRAMLFAPQISLPTLDSQRGHLNVLDLTSVVMALYGEHSQACPFERVSHYSGWLRYVNRMVRYLSEKVLCQFVYVQTVPRHPCESAPPEETLGDITLCYQRALAYALTPQQLGHLAVHVVEAAEGCIQWYYNVSHPYMILPDMEVPVPRPPEREVIDEITAQEDEEHGFLELSGRLDCIRDHVYVVMSSSEV